MRKFHKTKIFFLKKFIKNSSKKEKVIIDNSKYDEIYITTYCGVENL